MATWAVGDVHGCIEPLERLLDDLRFDPAHDRLLFVGDLVSRGPAPDKVLRLVRGLGAAAQAVLGNHDATLLGCALGAFPAKKRHRLAPVLEADDRDELVGWLRARPLMVREGSYLVVHAGLPPLWSLAEAQARARRAEAGLRGPEAAALLWKASREKKGRFDAARADDERVATLLAATSIRCVDARGRLDLDFTDPPEQAPEDLVPWYDAPGRDDRTTVVFGHWATLGLRVTPRWIALDSGCVYGGRLSAVRLEDRRVVSVEGAEMQLFED